MTDTRSVAITSARALFLTRGLEATRIEDVRDASGISTGSLYHHFGSKLGLLEAVVISALTEHKRALLENLSANLSAFEAVQKLIATTAGSAKIPTTPAVFLDFAARWNPPEAVH